MTRIILVRHGETTWNVEGRYQGQEDTPLSERGLEQGRLLAEGLKNIPLDRAISSPLQRSFKTCQFCADLHDLSVSADERLSEINHGSWEGRLASEIAEAYPEDFARWHSQPHLFCVRGNLFSELSFLSRKQAAKRLLGEFSL